ncbi:MAG TPA: response regulator [Terriglobia bacterium]|nr:response regulator [Terriglobia bacterium]
MDKENYKPTIMLVDDEEMVTTSLTNLFRLRTDYRIIACTSPVQALAEAGNQTFDLVIADYLMPGMNGIAFLSRFKEVQPLALRILLTGYADKESAIRAINQVGLYQYVEKPWDNDALLMAVKNALDKGALLRTLEETVLELQTTHASLKDLRHQLIRAFI